MSIETYAKRLAVGGAIGGAAGVLLDGLLLTVPGGQVIVITKLVGTAALAATGAAATPVSLTAVGTLVGAATGLFERKRR